MNLLLIAIGAFTVANYLAFKGLEMRVGRLIESIRTLAEAMSILAQANQEMIKNLREGRSRWN